LVITGSIEGCFDEMGRRMVKWLASDAGFNEKEVVNALICLHALADRADIQHLLSRNIESLAQDVGDSCLAVVRAAASVALDTHI